MSTDPDEELMGRLRAIAAEADAPPDLVRELASAALSTRRMDDLAELVLDSQEGEPVLVRGPGDEVRLLSFVADTVTVELQVTTGADTAALRGLVSGATDEVVLETPAGDLRAPLDPDGWFTAAEVPRGLLRLRLLATADRSVTTAWISL